MIPLLLIALGLGAALTAYEFSPRARTSFDDYARALRAAHTAHQVADAHLSTANVAAVMAQQHTAAAAQTPPAPVPPTPSLPSPPDDSAGHAAAAKAATDTGIDHVVAAQEANQEAAKSTAAAAAAAKTLEARAAVAQSADQVTARQQQIATALSNFGVGQCGVHTYPKVTQAIRDQLIARLHTEGMTVTGDNPWNIDTNTYGVQLRALWDPATLVLRLIVTAGQGNKTDHPYIHPQVMCEDVWNKIDPILKDVTRG
jgi:hypothetical protein